MSIWSSHYFQIDDIQEEMKTADIAKQMVKDTVASEMVSQPLLT